MTEDAQLAALEIKDPVEFKKYVTAIKVLQYISEDGMTVQSACQQAGITARTYYRWVEAGIFRTLIGGVITQAFHDTQLAVIDSLPEIIKVQVDIAKGDKKGTNFDIHNAAKFLMEKVLDPAMDTFLAEALPEPEEEAEDPAQKFLDAKKSWEDIPPGEKIVETVTTVVERQVPTVLEGADLLAQDLEEEVEQTPEEADSPEPSQAAV